MFHHQVSHCPLLAAHLQGGGWTSLNTTTAERALVGSMTDAVGSQLKCVLLTHLHTTAATYAFGFLIENLHVGRPPFRVMAPHTAQRTALQEKGCANARSVVDGIALDIENQGLQNFNPSILQHFYSSILFVLRSGDNLVLELLRHIVEIVAIASHTHQEVAIFIRMLLGIVEGSRVDNIELDMVSAKFEVGTDERGQFLLVFLTLQQGWNKTHVEQCTATLGLVELAQRLDDSRGSVRVAAMSRRGAVRNDKVSESAVGGGTANAAEVVSSQPTSSV